MNVFNRVLTEEEASELLERSYKLKYGQKFTSTFTNLIPMQENQAYVHINKNGMRKEELRYILSCLNREEAKCFRKLSSNQKGIYIIDDIEALILLSILSVYELCFTNFFFPILDTVIIGNFDLSFPVYSKTTTGFKKCKEIIEENDLFIRQ